jgi:hypothetical protein
MQGPRTHPVHPIHIAQTVVQRHQSSNQDKNLSKFLPLSQTCAGSEGLWSSMLETLRSLKAQTRFQRLPHVSRRLLYRGELFNDMPGWSLSSPMSTKLAARGKTAYLAMHRFGCHWPWLVCATLHVPEALITRCH